MSLQLREARDPADVEAVRALFREYQQSLGIDLCFQGFESELAALPGDYARPQGRLYLGLEAGVAAACIALRRLDATTAEMKRLYVRPAFRGRGHGRVLAQRVIDDARATGAARLVLDTLPGMREAQAMYEAFGFRDIPPYTHNPVPGARFMGLGLRGDASP